MNQWSVGHRLLLVVAATVFVLGLVASAARVIVKYQTPGPPDGINLGRDGYCDFHNGLYFPSLALLRGDSPYGAQYASEYPVARQIPFFSPTIVALHSPLSLLPLRVSEVLYFGLMIMMILAIAALAQVAAGLPRRLDWLLCIASVIVYSRAGHITLFNGYFTFELVLASMLAIYWGDRRPWLAALALLVVSGKPTFIIPIGFLLLARGNFRSVAYGAVLSIVGAVLPLLWLAANEGQGDVVQGLQQIRQQIADSQEVHHNEPNELPALSWTRIDIFAIFAKWTNQDPGDVLHLLAMLIILAWPCWLLWKRRGKAQDDGLAGLTGSLILTSMIVALYRQSYDALLMVAPAVGVFAGHLPSWRELGWKTRWVLAAMMLFPAGNYASTQIFLGRLDLPEIWVKVLTSVNAVVMAVLLIWLCLLTVRHRADGPQGTADPQRTE